MTPAPPPRLLLLVAREAPRILIIRRGPTRVYHLVLWETDTDRFTHGSWFRGQLYAQRCDLSFDGQWLVYFAMGLSREFYSWVALSRAPWLRAETLWPKDDCWHGGGVWLGPQQVWLNLPSGASHRPTDTPPALYGIQVAQSLAPQGEDEGPLFRRLARDGWQRAGGWVTPDRGPAGWLMHNDPGWFLQPTPQHPTLRMFFEGYYWNRGRVYRYALDEYPDLLDHTVTWAGWDQAGRLVVARAGVVARYTLADIAQGRPSLRYDLNPLTPPPPRPRRPIPPAPPPPPATPGPDAAGHYSYVGDPDRRQQASQSLGHPIHTQADLQALAPILRQDRQWSFEKPQTYVVTIDGVFRLGGACDEDVAVAGGAPVLAAGEATLEEDAEGQWHITALNNRSYGYMPEASSWEAVTQALAPTGIDYPRAGFTEVYPQEGSWTELLETLRAE